VDEQLHLLAGASIIDGMTNDKLFCFGVYATMPPDGCKVYQLSTVQRNWEPPFTVCR
jgi:hypothetical protein